MRRARLVLSVTLMGICAASAQDQARPVPMSKQPATAPAGGAPVFAGRGKADVQGDQVTIIRTPEAGGIVRLGPVGSPRTVTGPADLPGLKKYIEFSRTKPGFRLMLIKASKEVQWSLLVGVLQAIGSEKVEFAFDPKTPKGSQGISVCPYGLSGRRPTGGVIADMTSRIGPMKTTTAPVRRRKAPKVDFLGSEGTADHVVYVVDRSGSMKRKIDELKGELLKSINALTPAQAFHVIFFSSGTPRENPPRRLVYATGANKAQASAYLRTVTARGNTDPIPPMDRAFRVLDTAPDGKPAKLIYLLTDASFPPNKNPIPLIRRLNPNGKVKINTILYAPREEGKASKILKKIAAESKGVYRYVKTN